MAPFDMASLRALVLDQLDEASELAEEHEASLSAHRRRVLGRLGRCGDPQEGFVWHRCEPCDVDHVLATSCKTRMVCPRCGGRRMASTAAHLVERVLPDQPLRQWVVTFPEPLPRLLAWRPELLTWLLADLAQVVDDDLRRRTGELTGRSGMVSFVQNFT